MDDIHRALGIFFLRVAHSPVDNSRSELAATRK